MKVIEERHTMCPAGNGRPSHSSAHRNSRQASASLVCEHLKKRRPGLFCERLVRVMHSRPCSGQRGRPLAPLAPAAAGALGARGACLLALPPLHDRVTTNMCRFLCTRRTVFHHSTITRYVAGFCMLQKTLQGEATAMAACGIDSARSQARVHSSISAGLAPCRCPSGMSTTLPAASTHYRPSLTPCSSTPPCKRLSTLPTTAHSLNHSIPDAL